MAAWIAAPRIKQNHATQREN